MKIINKANSTEILVYEDIGEGWFGGVSAKSIIDALKGAKNDVLVRINSAGGDVFEGLAIYNALAQSSKNIDTQVDGAAFSAASVIFMAGKKRKMAENAFLMIHDAWSVVAGNAAELRERADMLDAISGSLAKIYSDASGTAMDEVKDWMAAETWFGANADKGVRDAVEDGFVTELVENLKVAAAWDPKRHHLQHPPESLTEPPRKNVLHMRSVKMAARARKLR